MICPRCQGRLVSESVRGVTIDRCSGCSGIWLDDGEIVQLLKSFSAQQPIGNLKTLLEQRFAGIPVPERTSVELCPKCQTAMNPVNYDYNSGVVIDQCPRHHGLWLDRGELERLTQYDSAAEIDAQSKISKIQLQLDALKESSGKSVSQGTDSSFLAALARMLIGA